MSQPARISYLIVAMLIALVGLLHLGTLALTALFGYFALRQFSFGRGKALGVAIYIIAVTAIGYGLFYFSRQAYKTLPEIADTTIPAVVNFAEKQGIELPFTDYASLKTVALSEVKEKISHVGHYVRAAAFQIAMLIMGLVVAVSLFVSARWEADDDPDVVKDSLYSTVVRELGVRFQTFYSSFAKVIGALAVAGFLQGAAAFLWRGATRVRPPLQFSERVVHVGSVGLDWQHIGTILITIAVGIGVIALVKYTTFGVALPPASRANTSASQ